MAFTASTVLVASWLYSYVTASVPPFSDVLDAAAFTAFALASPEPTVVFAIVFSALWYRALYGSTARAVVRCALYCAGIAANLPLWTLVPGHETPAAAGALVSPFGVMFVTVVVGRLLATQLAAREQSARRDTALVAVGARLLAVNDTAAIFACWWETAAEICAATPGLKVLLASERGRTLAIDGAAGGLATTPTSLPLDLVRDAGGTSGAAAIADPTALNSAVGTACVWVVVPLPEQGWDGWLLVGAPRQVPTDPLTALRSLINQVALALRNSEVHDVLATQAKTDALTGLANRGAFAEVLDDVLSGATARHAALLFLDLDDFKDVNDVLGHGAGDSLLREVAARLRRATRPEDICARLGGDEFAVLLGDTTGIAAETMAERLVLAVAAPVHVGNRTTQVGASVGVAYASDGTDAETLIHRTDVAMYAAKANGKNRVQVFTPGLLRPGNSVSLERRPATATAAGALPAPRDRPAGSPQPGRTSPDR